MIFETVAVFSFTSSDEGKIPYLVMFAALLSQREKQPHTHTMYATCADVEEEIIVRTTQDRCQRVLFPGYKS